MCIHVICYCVCSFCLFCLLFTLQRAVCCLVFIVLERFLLSLIQGAKWKVPLFLWGSDLFAPLWGCELPHVRRCPRPFSAQSIWAFFSKSGCLNLISCLISDIYLISDISGEVVIINSIYPEAHLVWTDANDCFPLKPGSPWEEAQHTLGNCLWWSSSLTLAHVLVLGGEAFGHWLNHKGRTLVNETVPSWKKSERDFCHVKIQPEVWNSKEGPHLTMLVSSSLTSSPQC